MKSMILFVFLTCSFLQNSFCSESDQVDQRFEAMERKFEGKIEDVTTTMKSMMESMMEEMKAIKSSLAETRPHVTGSLQEPMILNGTIEERVTLLELQVGDLENDLDEVEDEVTLLTSDQLTQDQRLLDLEIDTDGLEDSIEDLIATDVSVNLELESVNAELDSVDATLIDHEGRIQAQEVSGAIAFQVEIGEYDTIPLDTVVLFNQVFLNMGEGFDVSTGEFTVPPGGAGLYYFRFGYLSDVQQYNSFLIRVNGGQICRAYNHIASSGVDDRENAACAAVVTLTEGDLVHVYHNGGADDTPVYSSTTSYDNNFTGFRIAPE